MAKEANRVFVSELHKSALPHDLTVHDSEVIINGLIENHMVNNRVNLFSYRSDLLNAIDINELQQLVYLVVLMNLVNERPQELN